MFGCSQKYDKQMKRLILSYKQKDGLDGTDRSVFYVLMFKTLNLVASTSEQKALSVLSTTKADLLQVEEFKDLASNNLFKEMNSAE